MLRSLHHIRNNASTIDGQLGTCWTKDLSTLRSPAYKKEYQPYVSLTPYCLLKLLPGSK